MEVKLNDKNVANMLSDGNVDEDFLPGVHVDVKEEEMRTPLKSGKC